MICLVAVILVTLAGLLFPKYMMDVGLFTATGFGLLVLMFFVYFAPSLIAAQQGHKNLKALFVLNLFAGWTVLGWVGALVWAYLEQEKGK
jgi:hypothetical protein